MHLNAYKCVYIQQRNRKNIQRASVHADVCSCVWKKHRKYVIFIVMSSQELFTFHMYTAKFQRNHLVS